MRRLLRGVVFHQAWGSVTLIRLAGFLLVRDFFMDEKDRVTASVEKSKAQSILRSVHYSQGFHFFTGIGEYTGETAIDLFAFYEELRVIDNEAVSFHIQRRDFQNWIKNTLGDAELADKIAALDPQKPVDQVKKMLVKTVEYRLTELHTVAKDP